MRILCCKGDQIDSFLFSTERFRIYDEEFKPLKNKRFTTVGNYIIFMKSLKSVGRCLFPQYFTHVEILTG